jgi:hypothetical protein
VREEIPLSDLGIAPSERLPMYEVPLDLIEPEGRNPNYMDDDTFNNLVSGMEADGILVPIQIAPSSMGKFRLINGEHRWRGAQSLGWKTIPCNILLDEKFVDDDLRSFLMVRLNVVSGKVDRDKFLKLYREKLRTYGKEQLKILFGYTDSKEWKRVTQDAVKAMAKSGVIDRRDVKELTMAIDEQMEAAGSLDSLSSTIASVLQSHRGGPRSFAVFTHNGSKQYAIRMSERLLELFFQLEARSHMKRVALPVILEEVLENYFGE